MLGNELNGILLPTCPKPVNGFYHFNVTERYKHTNVMPTFTVKVPSDEVKFDACDAGYVLSVRPSYIEHIERIATTKGASEVLVYPSFGRLASV